MIFSSKPHVQLVYADQEQQTVRMEVRRGLKLVHRETSQVSYEAVAYAVNSLEFVTVLDVGCGRGEHSRVFRAAGKEVTTVDPVFDADVRGDIQECLLGETFDLVFNSHVVEHQRNVGAFLDRLFALVRDGGYLVITCPPEVTHWITGDHCEWMNGGKLLYHLVMAGFDCRDAKVLTYGYNVSVIVKKVPNNLPHVSWAADISEYMAFMPPEIAVANNQYNGAIHSRDWTPLLDSHPHMNSGDCVHLGEAE